MHRPAKVPFDGMGFLLILAFQDEISPPGGYVGGGLQMQTDLI